MPRNQRAAARRVVDPLDMDVDEAFAQGPARLRRRSPSPGRHRRARPRRPGCTTRSMSTPCSDSSPMTESTRNGMSSLTISSTEICLSRSPPRPHRVRQGGSWATPGLRSARKRPGRLRQCRQSPPAGSAPDPRAPRGRTRRRRMRSAPRSCRRPQAFRWRRGDPRGSLPPMAGRCSTAMLRSCGVPENQSDANGSRVFPIRAVASRDQFGPRASRAQ